jgi:DNA-binding MarR family transcriptional regulator
MEELLMAPVRIVMPDGAPRIIRKEQAPDARQFAIFPIRAARDKRLTAAQQRVLMVICSYANKGGFCWTGQARMARDLNISQQAFSVHFRKLKAMGYVETVFQGFSGERADTIRVIFKEDLTMQQVVEKTGAAAPFIAEKQEKKRRGRPPGSKSRLSSESKSNDNSQSVVYPTSEDEDRLLVLKSKVSSKVWDLAVLRVGNSTDYSALKQAITKLLR